VHEITDWLGKSEGFSNKYLKFSWGRGRYHFVLGHPAFALIKHQASQVIRPGVPHAFTTSKKGLSK
jgi:hypothetical protein